MPAEEARAGARDPAGARFLIRRSPTSAADTAARKESVGVTVPGIGRVHLPSPEHLAWYAGVAFLAAVEIVDWPVALVLAAGKALADSHSNALLKGFGEALEQH